MTMKAIVTRRSLPKRLLSFALGNPLGEGAHVTEIPIPEITEDEVLVKVCAVALNPVDFKDIDFISPRNTVAGCDYAGQVAKVGKNSGQRWKVGDRIAGFVHGGMYPDVGSFAEYLKVDGDLAWKVPETMSYAEAATYGVPAATAMLALAYLGIPWADIEKGRDLHADQSPILIYSGASNVGLFTIQLAKRAGLKVVVTASPRSFDLVKRYGSDAVYDYRSPTAAGEITKAYSNITRALDCFSEGGSTTFCANVLKTGKVITLLDQGKPNKPDIKYKFLVVYTGFGRQFSTMAPLGPSFPVLPSDRQALRQFYARLSELCHDLVRPPPIRATRGGFKDIFEGLNKLRKGEVWGTKLVVELQ
jgi:NADPH:quinone reductase-like Zn-dependent oxidoreductase